MKMRVVFCITVAAILDRWLKSLALNGRVAQVGFTKFTLVQNDALVFSWPAPNWLAAVLMALVIGVVIAIVIRRWSKHLIPERLAAVCLLVGAVSNLYDRIAYGFVIDWGYVGPWWPVFNLADIMIAIGILWWLMSQRRVDRNSDKR